MGRAVRTLAVMERIDTTSTARELEIRDVDLRYERCRVKNARAESALLADISARGFEQPLAGVASDEHWILIDGFKRLRCARNLGMGYVPCVTLGADAGRSRRWPGSPGGRQFCAERPLRHGLSRLCVPQASFHSPEAPSSPRRRNRSIPRTPLICPKTGSTVCDRNR